MYRAYNDICTEHTSTYLQSIRRDMYRAENETTTNTQTTMQKPTRQHCKTQPSKPDSNAKHASEEKHRERANRRLLCGNARGSTSKESLSKQIPMRKALRERAPRAQSRPEPISEKSGPDSKLEVFNTLLIVKVTKKWPGQVPALLAAPGASPGRRWKAQNEHNSWEWCTFPHGADHHENPLKPRFQCEMRCGTPTEHKTIYVQNIKRYMCRAYSDICTYVQNLIWYMHRT